MPLPDAELDRAVEYRRKMQAREDHKADEERALEGDSALREQLQINTNPLRSWDGWDPVRRVQGEESGYDLDA